MALCGHDRLLVLQLQGLEDLIVNTVVAYHLPCIAMVSYTSNTPQHDIGYFKCVLLVADGLQGLGLERGLPDKATRRRPSSAARTSPAPPGIVCPKIPHSACRQKGSRNKKGTQNQSNGLDPKTTGPRATVLRTARVQVVV